MSTIISIISKITIAYIAIAIGSPLVVPPQDLISFPPMMESREWREQQLLL